MTNPLMPLIEAMARGRRYHGDGEARRIIRTLICELDRLKSLPDKPSAKRPCSAGRGWCDGPDVTPMQVHQCFECQQTRIGAEPIPDHTQKVLDGKRWNGRKWVSGYKCL